MSTTAATVSRDYSSLTVWGMPDIFPWAAEPTVPPEAGTSSCPQGSSPGEAALFRASHSDAWIQAMRKVGDRIFPADLARNPATGRTGSGDDPTAIQRRRLRARNSAERW